MQEFISIASGGTFRLSRLFGVTSINSNGKASKFLQCYMTVIVLIIVTSSIYLRIDHLAGLFQKAPLDVIKFLMGLLMQFSVIGTCLSNLIQNLRLTRTIERIFAKLHSAGDTWAEKLWFVIVVEIHFRAIRTDISLSNHSLVKLTVTLMSLHSAIVALQFNVIVNRINRSLCRVVTHRRRDRIYCGEFSELIDTAKLISFGYRSQMLLILAQSFGYTITYTYYISHHVLSSIMHAKPLYTAAMLEFYSLTIAGKCIMIWLINSGPQSFDYEVRFCIVLSNYNNS